MADSPSWAADSKRLLYQTASGLKLVDVVDGRTTDVPINLTWTPAMPQGRMVVHAGRLFDGSTASLRTNVDIVIRDHRIEQVVDHRADLHTGRVDRCRQRRGDAGPDRDARASRQGLRRERSAASGCRTASRRCATPPRTPTKRSKTKEAIGAGVRVGPRVFATGGPFDGSRIFYSGGVPLGRDGQLRAGAAEDDRSSATT